MYSKIQKLKNMIDDKTVEEFKKEIGDKKKLVNYILSGVADGKSVLIFTLLLSELTGLELKEPEDLVKYIERSMDVKTLIAIGSIVKFILENFDEEE